MLRDKRFAYGLLLALAIALPLFLGTSYLRNLLVLTVIFAMLTLSLDIIVSGMGQFSFGHQAFFAIGAYTSAFLALRLGVTPLVGFLAAFVSSGLAGSAVGYVALRAVRGIYLAIVTLGFSVILFQVWSYFQDVTGGKTGLSDLPFPVIAFPHLPKIVFSSDLSYYYLALFFLLLTIYLINRWQCSRFGRAAASLRENEMLAKSIGISPLKVYTLTFVIATALAGLCGALYAHYVRFITPSLFGTEYIFILVMMLFVGGVGTMGGPVVGAIVYIFAIQFLPTTGAAKLVLLGAILLICILFMPQGIYVTLRSLGDKIIRGSQSLGSYK